MHLLMCCLGLLLCFSSLVEGLQQGLYHTGPQSLKCYSAPVQKKCVDLTLNRDGYSLY